MKIRIPVVVTKSGAVVTGYYSVDSDGKTTTDHSYCYDGFKDADYQSGYTLIHVDAEIDIQAIFKDHEIKGEVKT